MAFRPSIEDLAATEGQHRRVLPDDETVARQGECRALQQYLCERRLTRLQLVLPEEYHVAHHLGGPDVEADPFPADDWRRCGGEQLHVHVEGHARCEDAGRGDD